MKTSNILVVSLFLAFNTLSEIHVCEAQYSEIVKGIGFIIKLAAKASEHLEPLLDDHHNSLELHEDHIIQNQKLDKITTDIAALEKRMTQHFKELFSVVTNISSQTIHGHIAVTFENSMQSIANKLDDLIIKKHDVDKGNFKTINDTHFVRETHDYKNQLVQLKDQLEVIMKGKDYSHDFLAAVKDHANVCEDRMTQVQLLDSFRALYVDTISRYLMARHIIISLWERADGTSYDDKKQELNKEVRRYLLFYAKRFQELMAQSSREYQSCTTPAPSSQYFLHSTGKLNNKCYMRGEGDQSNQIVEFDHHFGNGKHCWDLLSLRPAIARPGYVVVGASIERNVNVLYVKIVEGKLLPNGMIDPKSITHNADPAPGIGDEVVQLDFRWSLFDITETIAPDNRVVTGLKFSQAEDEHLHLDVLTHEVDLDKGILLENTSRSEPRKKGLTEFELRGFERRNDTIIRNGAGLEPVKPNQFVKFMLSGRLRLHPAIELGDFYPTPLTLLSGVSLYVRQVHDTQGYLSIRLHTFNIVPHVTKIDFELNEDFADVLKSI